MVAPRARTQIDQLLRQSQTQFGEAAADRYRALLLDAFDQLLNDPVPVSARLAPVKRTAWMFHLRHVRARKAASERVASPRHFIVYRHDEVRLEIVQVLDDRMDLETRLS